jgi:hypothetical protein
MDFQIIYEYLHNLSAWDRKAWKLCFTKPDITS